MRCPASIATLVCVAALAAAPLADAVPIQFTLTGTITELEEDGMQVGGSVGVGTPIVVSGSFDTSLPDQDDRSSIGSYPIASPPGSLHVEVGGYRFDMPFAWQAVILADFEFYGYEYLEMYAQDLVVGGVSPPPGAVHNGAFLSLINSSDDTAIPSDSLLEIVPFLSNPALWDTTGVSIDFAGEDGGFARASGILDSSIVVVPETGCALTLMPWLALFAGRSLAGRLG
jgi:hypothetical protein